MKRITLAVSVLLLIPFSANAQTEVDLGLVKDGTYINSGLGFSFKYPQGWTVHGKETDEHIRELGKQKAAAQGVETRASLEASLKRTYSLLTVFRHPVGTPNVGFNPGLLIMAEKVTHAPGIKNGKDYMLNVRELIRRSGAEVLLKEPSEHTFAGWQFFRDDYALQSPAGVQVYQAYLAHVLKGYALVFLFMGEDQKSLDELVKSMETLTIAPTIRKGELRIIVDPSTSTDTETKLNRRSFASVDRNHRGNLNRASQPCNRCRFSSVNVPPCASAICRDNTSPIPDP